MIRERQVLDMVVHPISQIVTHARRGPFRTIAVNQIQNRGGKPKSEEQKRRLDQGTGFTLHQSLVDHSLNDTRHKQVEPGEEQQGEQGPQDLPIIRFQKGSRPKKVVHGGLVRIP